MEIYDTFVELYNNPNITGKDICTQLGLNTHRYMEIRDIAINNGDIPPVRRMNRTDAKFYTKTNNGYVVKKQFGHSCNFIGRFADEDTAKMVVDKCKEVNWNTSEIHDFIEAHKIKPRNYTVSSNGFTVQKTINGKNTVICTVNTESTAQKIVKELRKCNWNTEKINEIIEKVEA